MLDEKTIITVINRSSGSVGYNIPELGGLKRRFEPGEIKKIEWDELKKLSYQRGGEYILNNYLIMFNKEAVEELIGDVEPEYYYTNDNIRQLLLNGSLEQLDDCLSFAPEGVVESIKSIAVEMKLNDMNKRDLIFQKTGFSADNAIRNNKYAEDAEEKEKEDKKTRKTITPTTNITEPVKQRKASVPSYKVVTQEK